MAVLTQTQNSLQNEIKEIIRKTVVGVYPDLSLAVGDIPLEHPLVEEHGDYATSLPLKLVKLLPLGKRVFLENINWIVENVTSGNFEDYKNPLPVGRLSKEIQEMIGAKTDLVYLKPRIYAKIKGWWRDILEYLPLICYYPEAVYKDKVRKNGYLLGFNLEHYGVLVIELLEEPMTNEVVTIFFIDKGRLTNLIYEDKKSSLGRYRRSSLLAPRRFGGVAGAGFSSLQENYKECSKLWEESQGSREQEEAFVYEIKHTPLEVANVLADCLNKGKPDYLKKIEAAPPGFINFYLSKDFLIKQMNRALKEKEAYGSSNLGEGQTVVVDYSAPNIAKSFGIGHLRSTIIGQALYNLYKFSGYKVIGDNHLGDWGTQFGKILYIIDEKDEKDITLEKLEAWYVEFHKMAERDPSLEEKGREWFKKLEEGDEKARKLWKKCVDISLFEFKRIYDLLGVKIDYAYGESFYEDKMPSVIEEAKRRGIAKRSEGALIIEFQDIKTPLMLVKRDGTTTYATRDLATLKFRKENFSPSLIIYEVGVEQSLHLQQVFAAARMLGYAGEETALVHTKHGLYRLPHGKMSTRKGDTVKLESILLEAIERAKSLGSETEEVARAVGIGAVKYFDLKHNVQSDIIFDWEKMFNLEGDSGPYLQYAYARARSVLRKSEVFARGPLALARGPLAKTDEEIFILRYLYRFPEVVETAAQTYSPNLLCNYLYELAKRFNLFYNNVPIIQKRKAKSEKRKDLTENFRLALTQAVAIVLQNGLTLLGISAPERI